MTLLPQKRPPSLRRCQRWSSARPVSRDVVRSASTAPRARSSGVKMWAQSIPIASSSE